MASKTVLDPDIFVEDEVNCRIIAGLIRGSGVGRAIVCDERRSEVTRGGPVVKYLKLWADGVRRIFNRLDGSPVDFQNY